MQHPIAEYRRGHSDFEWQCKRLVNFMMRANMAKDMALVAFFAREYFVHFNGGTNVKA